MRYGAVDIGSNSCRLLIAELKGEKLLTLDRGLVTTRVAAGLNHTGIISEEAQKRTILCLAEFKRRMIECGVEKYRVIATSAVREADNQKEFVYRIKQQTGISIDVVSGDEEARLSYIGVEKGLQLEHSPLVVDLGGGSTEFICNDLSYIKSIPLGAVRATELDLTAQDIAEKLDDIKKTAPAFSDYPLVMVGGTATSLMSIKLGLEIYNPDLVHGQKLSRKDVEDIYHLLDKTPLAQRKEITGLQPERADIINKGALIILEIVGIFGREHLTVSESDLLQGIIWYTYNFKNN